MRPDRLIFVYNADGGLAQGLLDAVHKTLSPSTYACSLCAITYGTFAMQPKWRAWLKDLSIPTVFYHKDDVPYEDLTLPVVLGERAGVARTLISATQLAALGSVDALIAKLNDALANDGEP